MVLSQVLGRVIFIVNGTFGLSTGGGAMNINWFLFSIASVHCDESIVSPIHVQRLNSNIKSSPITFIGKPKSNEKHCSKIQFFYERHSLK